MAKSGKNRPAEDSDEADDATESHDADEGSQEEEQQPKAKKATGKQRAVSGKISGKSAAVKGKSTGRMKAVAPRPSGHEMVPVVCSECYEELVYDSGSAATEIVCPVCEHSAGKPDDATLHHISDKRRTERRNFLLVFALWFVGAVCLTSWVTLAQSPVHAADDAMFWGPFSLGALLFLVTMILTFKYEGSRWETYF